VGWELQGNGKCVWKKDEDDHGSLGTPENIEAVRRSVLQSPRRSARKHHPNNGHHLQDILFKTIWFKTFHVVVSESKNKSFVSQINFLLFTLKFREVILPHPVLIQHTCREYYTRRCFNTIRPPDDEQSVARNMYRIVIINVLYTVIVHQVGHLPRVVPGCTVSKT